jgi:hypothetical protein
MSLRRQNPLGAWVLRAISALLVVNNVAQRKRWDRIASSSRLELASQAEAW